MRQGRVEQMTAGSCLGSDISTMDIMVWSTRNGAPGPGILTFCYRRNISSQRKAAELPDATGAEAG